MKNVSQSFFGEMFFPMHLFYDFPELQEFIPLV